MVTKPAHSLAMPSEVRISNGFACARIAFAIALSNWTSCPSSDRKSTCSNSRSPARPASGWRRKPAPAPLKATSASGLYLISQRQDAGELSLEAFHLPCPERLPILERKQITTMGRAVFPLAPLADAIAVHGAEGIDLSHKASME